MLICWFWVILWIMFYFLGLSTDCMELFANKGILYIGNQYYRFLTGTFLHVNFLHLMANAITMYYVGIILKRHVESLVGGAKLIFFSIAVGSLTGGIFSLYAPECTYSIGGSVIVFALLGLILCVQIVRKNIEPFNWNTDYGKWIRGYIVIGNIPWFSDSAVSTLIIHFFAFGIGFTVTFLGEYIISNFDER